MEKRNVTRRQFLKGAGALAVGAAAMGMLGGCGTAADETVSPAVADEAVSAAETVGSGSSGARTVLAFASDQHAETAGFEAWIRDQQAVFGEELAHLSFGGDICDKAWDQATFDGFKAVLDELMPGKYCVTTGNQENKSGAPGASGWDAIGEGFVRIGEVVQTQDYIVYHFGAAQEAMEFPADDIQALSDYLETAPNNIPVFVISHFPLHLSVPYSAHDIPGGYRMTIGNDALTEVLNRHPNVIFMWGHNHTFADPRYGTIRPAGSKFTWNIDDTTQKLEIGFTYANLGSFCRGSTYGAIAEVSREDGNVVVKMYYVDTNVPMDSKESAVITFAPDGTVKADVTTSESTNYVDMFYLAGWYEDPSFEEDY